MRGSRVTLWMALLGLSCCAVPGTGDAPAVVAADVPAGPGSAEPNLVEGADGMLYLSWLEPLPGAEGHALRFSTWQDERWSAPRDVAAGKGWFVNWADFPSMAALADGTLAAHWLVKSAESTYAYDVWLSVSRDGGDTWSEPVRAHDDGTPTEHGFVSIVPSGERFTVLWLDGRRTADDPPGPMTLRWAWLDREGRVSGGGEVDDSVCDCCQTDAIALEDGAIVTAYRDRSPDEIRDIRVSRLEGNGWSEPSLLHDDGWLIRGCPVNGPALAALGRHLAAAWFTMPDGEHGHVRTAFSDDGGRTFGPPVGISDGEPAGRVDVVWLADGTAAVSWLEAGEPASIRVRSVAPDGFAGEPLVVTESSEARASGFPRMVAYEGRLFLVWTAVGEPSRIHTVILDGVPVAD